MTLSRNYIFFANNIVAYLHNSEIIYNIQSTYNKSDKVIVQSYEWDLVRKIYKMYLKNKRYSVMFFNFNEVQQNILIRYMQKIMIDHHHITTVWDNIDLTAKRFTLNDVLECTTKGSPTIGVYRNILDVYKDATHPTNQSAVRHSMNKTSLNQIFDKIGDTAGAISFVFCDCSSEELAEQTTSWEQEMNTKFESMYRVGRIDSNVETSSHNTVNFLDKSSNEIFSFATNHDFLGIKYTENILNGYIRDGYESPSSEQAPSFMKSVDSDGCFVDEELSSVFEQHDVRKYGNVRQNFNQHDPLVCI